MTLEARPSLIRTQAALDFMKRVITERGFVRADIVALREAGLSDRAIAGIIRVILPGCVVAELAATSGSR